MESLPKCFVGYPSTPPARVEVIETAIDLIKSNGVVDIKGWKSLNAGGRPIITRILEEIRDCKCFIADLTELNPNVLFELGYAIAHRKRVWLLLDTSIERAKLDFNRFQILSTVGYTPAASGQKIVEGFFQDQPYLDGTNLFDDLADKATVSIRPTLVYLKAQSATEASNRLTRKVSTAEIASIIDDPNEIPNQPLGWYINRVATASAVICHLLSSEHANWQVLNAKQAFVAGLAHGLGRPLLMLAHSPYATPLDYRDLLRLHDTAAQAEAAFDEWFSPLIESIRRQEKSTEAYRDRVAGRTALEQINLGEWIAEDESETVSDYFIPTATYNDALRANHSIFIGRKGTGKSATFFKLENELGKDVRNHVCLIKPVAYELEGIIQLLGKTRGASEKGFLIEALWKFLISTELAKSLYTKINSKPLYYGKTPAERNLVEFVEVNSSWIMPEFSVRLESAIAKLMLVPHGTPIEAHRSNISEKLHGDMLPKLKIVIGNLISSQTHRVIVLIDNLDKAWDQTQDLSLVSELLFGLLNVSNRIASDFDRDPTFRGQVNFSLILFLRSDIYATIVHFVHERDKLPVCRMSWEDPELLLSVLDERFMKSGLQLNTPDEAWQRYLTAAVGSKSVKQYLRETVLPRPRDLLYLVKTALRTAINRGHARIEEEDFLEAEVQYSHFALNSLMAENAGQIEKIEKLLAQFALSPEIINELDLLEYIERADVKERPSEVIDFLTDLAFLGMEVEQNRFEFIFNEDHKEKLRAMADRSAGQNPSGLRRFRINRAYHRYLEVRPGSPSPGQEIIPLTTNSGRAQQAT